MLTDEQQAARKIGSSEIAAALGISQYKTPLELYREKIGEAEPFAGNLHTQAGEIMEAAISDLYEHITGRKLRRMNQVQVHPEYPFLTATLDRVVVGEKRIVEIKNINFRSLREWGEEGTDEVPAHYLMQVHHQMLVMDWPVADIAAYFGGGDLRIYPVERSADMDAIIIDGAREFWRCVETRTPPPFDPSHPNALAALKRIYTGTTGEVVTGDSRMLAWAQVERDAAVQAARYSDIADGAKAHILAAMGEAAMLKLPDGSSYTRKTIKRSAYTVEPTEYVQLRFVKAAK